MIANNGEQMAKASNSQERRIEWVPLGEVQSAPTNPKEHDIGEICVSIGRRGFVELPAIDERTGRLVAGHGRIEALIKMQADKAPLPGGLKAEGGKWLVPVVRGWASKNDADAAAYLVASNRLVELGGWNDEMLAKLMSEIAAIAPDEIAGSGFDQQDVDKFINEMNSAVGVEPEIPEIHKTDIVRGDVFELGDHKILCGDSTKAEDVARVVGDSEADLVWTDPPYGVDMGSINASLASVGKASKTRTIHAIEGDGVGVDLPALLVAAFKQCFNILRPGGHIYIAHPAGEKLLTFLDAFRAAGFKFKQGLIWDKGSMVLGLSDYHYQHEPIIYGIKPGAEGRQGRGGSGWYGDNSQVSVLSVPKPQRSDEHPTMKPLELIEIGIKNSSAVGDVVFEPFSGSGSTLLACERLGRKCRAVEIDPRFVQVAITRWEKMTGRKAVKL